MKTKGTFMLSEEYGEIGNDNGTGTATVVVDIDYLRKTFTVKPSSFENNPEFKFRNANECYATAELFMNAAALVNRELAPQTSPEQS